jgi:hypothetical protein
VIKSESSIHLSCIIYCLGWSQTLTVSLIDATSKVTFKVPRSQTKVFLEAIKAATVHIRELLRRL